VRPNTAFIDYNTPPLIEPLFPLWLSNNNNNNNNGQGAGVEGLSSSSSSSSSSSCPSINVNNSSYKDVLKIISQRYIVRNRVYERKEIFGLNQKKEKDQDQKEKDEKEKDQKEKKTQEEGKDESSNKNKDELNNKNEKKDIKKKPEVKPAPSGLLHPPDPYQNKPHPFANLTTDLCIICMTDSSTVAMLPCCHLSLCLQCARVLLVRNSTCPVCRTAITDLLHLMIPGANNDDEIGGEESEHELDRISS
jgi:hypothetical protein